MTKSMVLKVAGLALLTIGVSSVASATSVPEIDAATGAITFWRSAAHC